MAALIIILSLVIVTLLYWRYKQQAPHLSVHLKKTLPNNAVIIVSTLPGKNTLKRLQRHVNATFVSHTNWQATSSNFEGRPIWVGCLCGAHRNEPNNKPTYQQRHLLLAAEPAEPSTSIAAQLETVEVTAWQRYIERQPLLMKQWLTTALQRSNTLAVADSAGTKLSFRRLLIATWAMADLLKKPLHGEHNIGLLMPPSAGGTLGILSLWWLGKTIVGLNYTASLNALHSACEQSQLQHILTSRRFVQQLKKRGIELDEILNAHQVIYLEDLKKQLSKLRLLGYLTKTYLLPKTIIARHMAKTRHTDTAMILFSSGSEGHPKGVQLSFANLLGNVKQIAVRINLGPHDAMLSILPIFHAFGLTATTLLPLIEGVTMVCHPDPRDASTLGKLTEQYQATILCGTSTFFRLYAKSRHITSEQFQSIRYVIAGAERLQPDVRTLFEAKFQRDIYEGYGTTELSPVACVNQPDDANNINHVIGTVGRTLPGCAVRIVDPDSHKVLPIGEAGMIAVAGINVMQSYLNAPDKTEQAFIQADGLRWYLTGDKGQLSEHGFLQILDRYSRFAKLGGEMVSLTAVESSIKECLAMPEIELLAVAVPDPRKGEQIVLLVAGVTTKQLDGIQHTVTQAKINNLMKPQRYQYVENIPKLGSGKTDFSAARKLAIPTK